MGAVGLVRAALTHGADPTGADDVGVPILTYAAAFHGEDSSVSRLLVEHGADKSAQFAPQIVVRMFHRDGLKRETAIRQARKFDEVQRETYALALYSAEML